MKKVNNYLLFFSIILLFGFAACEKSSGEDSMDEPDTTQNKSPNSFDLIAVQADAINVPLNPQFSWDVANDPEDDVVTYDFYLGVQGADLVLLESNISNTNFVPSVKLKNFENYIWRVTAKDSEENTTESVAQSFTTKGYNLNLATSDTGILPRSGYTALSFNDDQWAIGGYRGVGLETGYKDDIYRSSDGVIWNTSVLNPGFASRTFHASVVHDDRLWVLGGESGQRPSVTFNLNDVWSSADGVTWTAATINAGFSKRRYATAASFDGKLWVIAGQDEAFNWKNDIWSSQDGVTWTQVTANAPFSSRGNAKTFVFDNKLWVVGGNDDNSIKSDIWYTTDGVTWTELVLPSNFNIDENELGMGGLVYKSKLLLFQGKNVFFTRNGLDWFTGSLEVPQIGFSGELNLAQETIFTDHEVIWLVSGSDFTGSIQVYNYSEED